MSKESISSKSQTDWQRIDKMDDRDIDLSDCPEVTAQMFDRAVVRRSAKKAECFESNADASASPRSYLPSQF
ncbi:MAG: hypothetical protein GDA43_13925 [Hormoscilla sp. SP5CHS1]|nr:hypothetical protein [Hormoscilla sp. SP12CHS1]MBC6454154.1 hypothetical protein [Hormoscilla sp. SP5CHS1]